MFDFVKIHTHQPATDNSFPSSTALRNGGMTCQASTYTGQASSEDSSLLITDKVACSVYQALSQSSRGESGTGRVKWLGFEASMLPVHKLSKFAGLGVTGTLYIACVCVCVCMHTCDVFVHAYMRRVCVCMHICDVCVCMHTCDVYLCHFGP